MSDAEIRRGIEQRLELLQARILELTEERDRLQREVNEYRALRCANPACQLCQIGDE